MVLGFLGRRALLGARTRLVVEGRTMARRGQRSDAVCPIAQDGEDAQDGDGDHVEVGLERPRPSGEAAVVEESMIPDAMALLRVKTEISDRLPVVPARGPLGLVPVLTALLLGVTSRIAGGADRVKDRAHFGAVEGAGVAVLILAGVDLARMIPRTDGAALLGVEDVVIGGAVGAAIAGAEGHVPRGLELLGWAPNGHLDDSASRWRRHGDGGERKGRFWRHGAPV